ncbi:hypothetical protein Cfor_10235 [Coptotermes formosanus]|jgi:hypothetical protein|uniref:Gustatory receptor n=1 Tax=Coptotermes formosanus TaxID=36987 RepID=A0A6L2PH40_COPFO|nr:hypothetical protein Cfor_10235 [Coptotermes formosanus]
MFDEESFNTDIYSGVKPLHFVAQFIGLAPYFYIRNTQTGEESIDISCRSNAKKITWASVLVVIQFTGLACKMAGSAVNPPDSLVDLVNDILQFPFFGATSMVAILFAVTINRNKMSQFLNTLSVVDRLLFCQHSIYKKQQVRLLIAVTYTSVFSAVLFYFDIYYYYTYNLLYIVTIYLPDFVWSVNELQFMNVVEVLTARLVKLNASITEVFDTDCYIKGAARSVRKHNGKPTINRYASVSNTVNSNNTQPSRHQICEEFVGNVIEVSCLESKIISRILKLREIYNKLYEMCSLIDSMYGYMLLQQFTSYAICMIVDGYNLLSFLVALYNSEAALIPPEGYPALVLWNFSNLFRPFLVCLSCHRLNNEFKTTVKSIQTLTLRSGINTGVLDQLRLFSIQVQNCKLGFTACGFFDINLSLSCAVFLTATTYITVLVLLDREQ